MKKPKIGLSLGGGGARGLTHIGVLQVLEEHGIKPDIIVGTSMGSIIGGAYACGVNPYEMEKHALKMRTINLYDINIPLTGIFSGRGAERSLNSILKNVNIEEMNTKFACTAADLISGEEVVFKSGSLRKAVRASFSIPGIFAPVNDGDRYLVDGGVVDNIPDKIVKDMGADVIISVDPIGKYEVKVKPKTFVQTLLLSFFLQQSKFEEIKKQYYDIRITPEQPDVKIIRFNAKSCTQSIKAGRAACLNAITAIQRAVKKAERGMNK